MEYRRWAVWYAGGYWDVGPQPLPTTSAGGPSEIATFIPSHSVRLTTKLVETVSPFTPLERKHGNQDMEPKPIY